MTEPLVLGIETSCDETGLGIVRGRTLLSNTIASSMVELLADFSTAPLPVEPGIWPPIRERVEAVGATSLTDATSPPGEPAVAAPASEPALTPAAVRDPNL